LQKEILESPSKQESLIEVLDKYSSFTHRAGGNQRGVIIFKVGKYIFSKNIVTILQY